MARLNKDMPVSIQQGLQELERQFHMIMVSLQGSPVLVATHKGS